MNKTLSYHRLIVFSVIFMTCGLALWCNAAKASRPNVVIILADDQGWGDLSVNGNTNLHTPNIDSFAKQSASFDRFYVCPLCAPTRAEFLTGRYHLRGGVRGVSVGQERLNLDEKTIADAFKKAGYATGAFGKWHNGSQWPYHPNARGFDEYYGFTSGHWGEYFDPPLDHNGHPVRGNGYVADDFTDHAMEFMAKNKGRPFFCYLPFNTPHTPFAVPQKYWQRFKNQPITMRARPGDEEELEHTRCVLAMCENIDWNVGRVLRKLDELGLTDNTIVIYFSDNGPAEFRWNGDMKGRKGSTDEGGVRVPFFIRWPGKIKPGNVREIAGAIDLLPTLTSLAGIARIGDKPLDGKDISPLLFGTSTGWSDRTILSCRNEKISARSQRYRLDSAGALFDMVADPGQRKDIATDKPEIVAELSKAVASFRGELTSQQTRGRKHKADGNKSDPRPFTVGYAAFPRTPLPARDGIPHGTIKRSASAPNSSYFVNWKQLDDSITWDIDVATTGDYAVEIQYTCPEGDAGSTIELSFNGSKLSGKVEPAWDPPLYTNQDTITRPAPESRMKPFHALKLGTMHLTRGRGVLTLRALQIPGASVMDMREVDLTLK